MLLAAIPSPTRAVWHLGPLPVRAYALCIVAGIALCLWITVRRFTARGGTSDDVWNVAGWAIVFGIIGGRLYHVVSDPELYFESGRHPIDALKIWDGGLGIWGAIALGGLGAWIGCRRHGMRIASFADACVPGVILAQAAGRWGNWFNNELYGGPTSVPWKLAIHNIDVTQGVAQACYPGGPVGAVCGYYQPTFLYESLWDIGVAILLVLADRRFRMGHGTVFALYVMAYTAGRGWIEALRTDHANHFLGLRLNDWTSIVVFLIGLAIFLRGHGFRSEREASPYLPGRRPSLPADPAERDTGRPGTEQPDTEQPDTDQPDTARPDTARPGTDQPDPARPDAGPPGEQPEPGAAQHPAAGRSRSGP